MKNLIIIAGMLLGFLQADFLKAGDDVYDAPQKKQARVKQISNSNNNVESQKEAERTVPYYDEDNNTRTQSNIQNSNNYDNYYADDFNSSGLGYSDRIRRFHNSSIQFSYGYNNYSYYDPYNSYNSYGWNNYAFTPSWTYGYSNFYNPFCSNNTQIIIIQPGYGSWYNSGFYSPYYSWNHWGWMGFSPVCSNIIYNNAYPYYYGGYYDANRKDVVYGPRTTGYGNSHYTNSGSSNTNNGNNNSNNWNVNNNTNNSQNNTTSKKWTNRNGNQNNSGNWSNPYKKDNSINNNVVPNNDNSGWKSNNNSNSVNPGNGTGGVKIGSRPK